MNLMLWIQILVNDGFNSHLPEYLNIIVLISLGMIASTIVKIIVIPFLNTASVLGSSIVLQIIFILNITNMD